MKHQMRTTVAKGMSKKNIDQCNVTKLLFTDWLLGGHMVSVMSGPSGQSNVHIEICTLLRQRPE